MADEAPPLGWAFGSPEQRKAWNRYWVRDTIGGLGFTVLYYAMQPLPRRVCSDIGAALGRRRGPKNPFAARRARGWMRRLRPELDEAGVEAALDRMWANVGRSFGEFPALHRIWDAPEQTPVEGLQHLEAARATGRPRLLIGVHTANWEMVGPRLISLGEDLIHFYQPPRNRFERALIERVRRRFAAHLAPPTPAATAWAVRRLMRDGTSLVLFVDDTIKGDVGAPLFGRPFRDDSNLAYAVRLAQRSGALVLPVQAVRRGSDLQLCILPPLDFPAKEALEPAARRLNAVLEAVVLAHTEQWFMLHEMALPR